MSDLTPTHPAPRGHATSLDEALHEVLIPGPHVGEASIQLSDLAGMKFLANAPSGHTLVMDTDPSHGGADQGLRPQELLLVALAGCTAMDAISILPPYYFLAEQRQGGAPGNQSQADESHSGHAFLVR